jgi:hypothetical protein
LCSCVKQSRRIGINHRINGIGYKKSGLKLEE